MATTTNYGWTTPDDTALVKDGAAAIRTLGSSVDTTTKALNPSTTLGDIEYRSSTANTNTRLGIGTNGQILTVVAGVPSWGTAASASPVSANSTVSSQEYTSSSSYTTLTTGQSVTITTGTKVLVLIGMTGVNDTANTGGGYMSYAISGATTRAVSDEWAVGYIGNQAANVDFGISKHSFQTVTAGSNTFTANFKRTGSGGNIYFKNRYLTVIDLGS